MWARLKRHLVAMDPNRHPIANPDVVLREEFDDWAVLFNPDTAAAMGVNPVGVAVWKRMDGKRTLAEITSEIGSLFQDTPETALEEIAGFVDRLAAEGYILYEVADVPTGSGK